MGLQLKVCARCGRLKKIAASRSRCRACRTGRICVNTSAEAQREGQQRKEAVKDLLAALAPLPYATRLAIQQEVSRSAPADFWKARSRAFRLIHVLKETP